MGPIVVALDASPRAAKVLRAAQDIAVQTGAPLVLVRAIALPHEIQRATAPLTPADLSLSLAREAREELASMEATLPPEQRGGVRVAEGVPWEFICETARSLDARLIVIGAHGFGFWDRLLGTTSSRVVNHADRSVLVVRDHPAPSAP
jgi:nucleotide-binding universal stress UspA family protein